MIGTATMFSVGLSTTGIYCNLRKPALNQTSRWKGCTRPEERPGIVNKGGRNDHDKKLLHFFYHHVNDVRAVFSRSEAAPRMVRGF